MFIQRMLSITKLRQFVPLNISGSESYNIMSPRNNIFDIHFFQMAKIIRQKRRFVRQ